MVCEWGMLPFSCEVSLPNAPQQEAARQQWLCQARGLAAYVLDRHRQAWERLCLRLEREETVDGSAVAQCMAAEEAKG